ncbi:hypothetical protein CDD81_6570 [Ophiocordyceps australis]|uniref:Uncharacterized protein n=1 Tax=Ophiocordyceps australis TaxID=1399860 RepID=A0A2C5Y2N0_9HYPO|nr:hypothetical protein CDD81_6570 [Ophiocordyceps australis]
MASSASGIIYQALIQSNCQAILGGDANIDVVSQLDAQTFTWQIHAVKTDGAERINMLTGQGMTLQAAFEDLHDRTALAMDRVCSRASPTPSSLDCSTPASSSHCSTPPSSSLYSSTPASSPHSSAPTSPLSFSQLPSNANHDATPPPPPPRCKPAKRRHNLAGANIRLHLRWSGFKDVHFAVVCAPTSPAIQDAVQQLVATRQAHEFGPVPAHKLQGAHRVLVRKAGFSDGQVRAATDAGGGLVAAVKKAQRAARRRRVHMLTLDHVWVDVRPLDCSPL